MLCSGGLWLSGSDAARALDQASLSPMLEDEGWIFFSNNYVIAISGQAIGFFPLGTPVCSPSLTYLQNKTSIPNSVIADKTSIPNPEIADKTSIPNSVIAELALRTQSVVVA